MKKLKALPIVLVAILLLGYLALLVGILEHFIDLFGHTIYENTHGRNWVSVLFLLAISGLFGIGAYVASRIAKALFLGRDRDLPVNPEERLEALESQNRAHKLFELVWHCALIIGILGAGIYAARDDAQKHPPPEAVASQKR